jgi:hypothetical protein
VRMNCHTIEAHSSSSSLLHKKDLSFSRPQNLSPASSEGPTTPSGAASDSMLSDTDASGDESARGRQSSTRKRSVSFNLAAKKTMRHSSRVFEIWRLRNPVSCYCPISALSFTDLSVFMYFTSYYISKLYNYCTISIKCSRNA